MSGTKAENKLPAQPADSLLTLTGATPLSEIHLRIGGTLRPVWLKLESYNPAGSLKDGRRPH